ncbi:related to TR4 orphan receptor associated protein TRA16 [Ustilago trichophora]|uniref:Related to TR4 orphan receptor associated protein TRA16 n=1 Tax=Ustilago trichophora TaxID=86804 RepID=A0A5C3E8V1_9BASI|nr:related to TR4 orphan receptor associated protein TRA16 [Ustilago trichophora]
MSVAPTLTPPSAPEGRSLTNLLAGDVKVKVSSGPSKSAKNILDDSTETCWTSDNLPPNSDPSTARYNITFKLAQPIAVRDLHSLSLTFAGGFSPMSFNISSSEEDGKTWSPLGGDLFPSDTNAKQYFDVSRMVQAEEEAKMVKWLRLELQGSTDDYGRMTIYQAEIFVSSA